MRAEPLRALMSTVIAASIVASGQVTGAAPAGASPAPAAAAAGVGTEAAAAAPTASAGWNDWSCRPSPAHPHPVVLLHGLGGRHDQAWSDLAPYLSGAGWCVFSLTYGQDEALGLLPFGGVGPVVESADEIAGFMDDVRAATGAPRVDLVGHSEGGVLALYVTKVLDRAGDVGTVVTLGSGVEGDEDLGTDDVVDLLDSRPLLEAVAAGMSCPACTDLLHDSPFRRRLVDGPVAQPGVSYTLIFTLVDEFKLLFDPTASPFLDEPGVRNRFLQHTCPLDLATHSLLPYSRGVAGMVHEALDPDGAPPVRCGIGVPLPLG